MKTNSPTTDRYAFKKPGGTIEYVEAGFIRTMEIAIRRILAEPHGCRFCDSGILRNPSKTHDHDCGYDMAKESLHEPHPRTWCACENSSNDRISDPAKRRVD